MVSTLPIRLAAVSAYQNKQEYIYSNMFRI